MQVPIQITYRDVKHSPEVDQHIHEKAEKLKQFSDDIISCAIVVEYVSKHQHSGSLFNVRINLTVPGRELISTHNYNENMYVSINDTFADIGRQLEEYSHMRHGRVKHHPPIRDGKVVRLYSNYGFIETVEGGEYYFNEGNVVRVQFARLLEGEKVRFIEHMGDQGLQAHRVSVHHRENDAV